MKFVKMEGLGNDFVVVEGPADIDPDDVAAWCDRRRGVGADGVLEVSSIDSGTVRMRYWNADGSVAEMCGNGLRCVTRYAYDRGWTDGPDFHVETTPGRLPVQVLDDEQVRVMIGSVTMGNDHVIDGRNYRAVSVGNPHAVTFVDDPAAAPVREVGPQVEHAVVFPEGANVEFVTAEDGCLRLRVWERGVGETLACGTGAVAAAAAAHQRGDVGTDVPVDLPGGRLRVELIDGQAWITGAARYVFEGVWSEG
jgi:diaminopimelate epimerase